MKQLVEKANQISRRGVESSSFAKSGEWRSTSISNPLQGSIFIPVIDGAQVEFKNKYGEPRVGVIADIEWSRTLKGRQYTAMIRTTTGEMIGGDFYTDNYSLPLSKVEKLIGKKIQVPSQEPTFK